jgi:hypothetical protein
MMKRILLSFAAAALLAALPGPAPAAPSSSAAVYDAGRCIVSRDYNRALGLLLALPLDDQPADLGGLRGTAAEPCAADVAGASALTVRGALAQALFIRDFGSFGHDPRTNAHLINLNLPVQDDSRAGTRTLDLYRWGDCVVRNDPAATQRLLASANGSPEEGAAMTELGTFMVPCMPFGVHLTVQLREARAVFAQAAYHAMYRYATGQLQATSRPR